MPESGIVKKINKWEPKSQWEDDVRNDLKLIKWTEQVQDCLKWKVIVEKAKTLLEL